MSAAPASPRPDAGDASVEAAVAQWINQACDMHASDLFLGADEQGVYIGARQMGIVVGLSQVGEREGRRYINHIKAMSGIDVADHRRPGDGRWIFARPDGRQIDLRVNCIPTLYGEDVALRILDRDVGLRPPERLGLVRRQLNDLMAMLASPSGLILVAGPTGAGKTTTLYACLRALQNGRRKINTIEDPIEYAIEGVRQSQVHPEIGVDFPALLRSVLRQSPDVIMIGEIRDPETAQTAIRAANSGQLVLATVHAPVAAGAIQSMLSLEVAPHFLSTCLRGVIAQRLVRVLCPECKTEIDVSGAPHTFDELRGWLEPGEGHTLHAAVGCAKCYRTGYSDRTGVFEVLPIDADARALIARSATTAEIEQKALADGLLDFRRSGLLKVAQGITTTEELVRVIPGEYLV